MVNFQLLLVFSRYCKCHKGKTAFIIDSGNIMTSLCVFIWALDTVSLKQRLVFNTFLDALASLELVMRVRGYQIFREIFPSWYLVNRTNGQ